VNGIEGQVIMWALAGVTVAKTGVDLVRMAKVKWDAWVYPLLALLFGIGAVVLFMLAAKVPFDQAAVAVAILGGILAGGGAVGVTDLSKRANPPSS
jgi:hypothetical protein